MYSVEVIADESGKFIGNGLTFKTFVSAKEYALDLAERWTMVRDFRILKNEEVVYSYNSGWLKDMVNLFGHCAQ